MCLDNSQALTSVGMNVMYAYPYYFRILVFLVSLTLLKKSECQVFHINFPVINLHNILLWSVTQV